MFGKDGKLCEGISREFAMADSGRASTRARTHDVGGGSISTSPYNSALAIQGNRSNGSREDIINLKYSTYYIIHTHVTDSTHSSPAKCWRFAHVSKIFTHVITT